MRRYAATRARRGRSTRNTNAPKCSRRSTCVDAVSIFDEDTPADIIRRVQPDILVKGADWPADQIVGRDTVEARGGRVILRARRAGLLDDRSMVEKLDTHLIRL